MFAVSEARSVSASTTAAAASSSDAPVKATWKPSTIAAG